MWKAQQGPKASKNKNVKREAAEENATDYVDPHTPFGEKKQLSSQMAKKYNPIAVENSWVATFYCCSKLCFLFRSCLFVLFTRGLFIYLLTGGTSGGKNQNFLWRILAVPSLHLLLWAFLCSYDHCFSFFWLFIILTWEYTGLTLFIVCLCDISC